MTNETEGDGHGLPILHPLKIFDATKRQDRFLYACAPMVRYSKLAFRQTVHQYGVDLCWTPMILSKEFNRNQFARDSDFTISTKGPQPQTIVQFGSNSPLEFSRSSSLVAPFVSGVDLNCGCPQAWACAETLGAALIDKRELVRDMVVETRRTLAEDGWHVGKDKDMESTKGRSVSVKIRVHHDLRKTMDFIETVVGHPQNRNIDFLTIHPRTRRTSSAVPINTEALSILTDKFGDTLPILLSGDVFSMGTLPISALSQPPTFTQSQTEGSRDTNGVANTEAPRPSTTKLAGFMSARGILANPALFAGYEACPWEAVGVFMQNVARCPLPFKLTLHHLTEMCGPGMGSDKHALLTKQERITMLTMSNICELMDFLDDMIDTKTGRTGGLTREPLDRTERSLP